MSQASFVPGPDPPPAADDQDFAEQCRLECDLIEARHVQRGIATCYQDGFEDEVVDDRASIDGQARPDQRRSGIAGFPRRPSCKSKKLAATARTEDTEQAAATVRFLPLVLIRIT